MVSRSTGSKDPITAISINNGCPGFSDEASFTLLVSLWIRMTWLWLKLEIRTTAAADLCSLLWHGQRETISVDVTSTLGRLNETAGKGAIMSFTQNNLGQKRLTRSHWFILSSDPAAIDAAARSDADVVMFELEDAIPPELKADARKNVLQALNDIDWGRKTVSMRISGLDTQFMYRDLVDVLEGPSERLDMVMIPKAGTASDVYAVDMLVTQIEQATGRTNPIGLEVMIETALGMTNISQIAGASTRLEALHLGENDYATSMGMEVETFGGPHSEYSILTGTGQTTDRVRHWNDPWHYALSRVVTTARAYGLRPMDVGFLDRTDPDGCFAAARRAAVLGFEGKWASYPEAVELVHKAFTPPQAAIDKAQRIVDAANANSGARAFELDGKIVLMPQVRDAEALLGKARQIKGV